MIVIAFAVNESAGLGLMIPGCIVTSVGLLLGYQNITNHWESWAYAWALIAPGSVGIAMFVFGTMRSQPKLVKDGKKVMTIGAILFICGFVFFELIIGISGFGFRSVAWPILIIGVGVFIVIRNLYFVKQKAK
ncbi:hypothetical protein JW960_22190 [candidate division KSB1 bacterium]|nr:hypothetical protein [candidate division KSB1 bacterium]